MNTYFAPGKVVILGEYAVLDGAPALVAAIDRGVRCLVWPSQTLQVQTPDSDARFVGPALTASDAPPRTYRFESHPPQVGAKLGLGSSAAATVVAVIAARAERGLDLDPRSIHPLAAATHRAVQGSGSGLDVAASTYGGVLRIQNGQVVPRPLPLPFDVVATGQPASTGPRVQRYLAWPDREAFVRESAHLLDQAHRTPLEALRQAGALLSDMARQAGIDYLTPALRRIATIADDLGGAAKPSGAGGGDIAIAMLPDPEARARFRARCQQEGLLPLDLRLAPGASPLPPESSP